MFQLPSVTEVDEMQAVWKAGVLEECTRLLERERDEWKDVELNVAVIGNSGVGKSSFINAIRGLNADDEGAAAVGVKETMVFEILSYEHPNNPMMKFWDLPGVGTVRFPRITYLADIDVYDFFLLLNSTRMTENDTWLGNEIHKRNKKYFFVRTKIGVDIRHNRRARPRTHNEEAVIEEIRKSKEDQLRIDGCDDVPVFVVDSYKPHKFDFEKLNQQLIKYFQEQSRTALILSLKSDSQHMIQLKVAELRSLIWKSVAISAVGGAFRRHDISLAMDQSLSIITCEVMSYFKQLGLDSESLQRYDKLYSVDYDKVQSLVRGALRIQGEGEVSLEEMKSIVARLMSSSWSLSTATAVKRQLPLIGSLIAAEMLFRETESVLNLILDKFEKTAIEVMKFVAVSVASANEIETSGGSRILAR